MSTALHDLSAHDVLAGYKARDFSPVEVTQAVLAQIERREVVQSGLHHGASSKKSRQRLSDKREQLLFL